MNISPHNRPFSEPYRKLRAATLILVIAGLAGATTAMADGRDRGFSEQSLRGTWVWSGLMKFGAPIPIPATVVDGAMPHDPVAPGDVVGVWASSVGLMNFDGAGGVNHAEEVVKVGEIAPLPGLPFEALPPFGEVYTGGYSVSEHGVVQITLTGRDSMSPEGDVDFEYDLHCVLNRWPMEMACVPARFKTYLVNAAGYAAPITGTITLKRQY